MPGRWVAQEEFCARTDPMWARDKNIPGHVAPRGGTNCQRALRGMTEQLCCSRWPARSQRCPYAVLLPPSCSECAGSGVPGSAKGFYCQAAGKGSWVD